MIREESREISLYEVEKDGKIIDLYFNWEKRRKKRNDCVITKHSMILRKVISILDKSLFFCNSRRHIRLG